MFCQEAVMTLGSVPLASYATTGTDEVADSLIPFIHGHEAILLANHGAVTYGRSLPDAFTKMETLEHLAQIRLVTHQLGSAQTLEHEQAARLLQARERYVQNAM
jgi:L-fuculose-phosphate aldolase